MEKDQEQKLLCKVCGKSFSSGMSLGGHMRSHFVKKSAKKPKVHNSKLAFVVDDDDDNDDGYVLSEFKKKSLNVSNEENSTVVYENETKCKECGKEFPSVRSLCGHMRWHTVKPREEDHVCRQCGKEFDSMRALFGHMTHHSRKSKVLNESAYSQSDSEDNVTGNFHSSCLYSSSYDVDSVEIEEAAVILMMLSRGMTQRGLSNLVLKESEGTGLICKLDILDKKKNKMNRQKKLAMRGSCSSFMYEKEEPDFDDLDSLSPRGDRKKVRMEVSDDRFDQDDDFGNEFSGLEINGKRKRVEPGKNFNVEKLQCKENSAEVKRKGSKKSKHHVCRICSKSFQTRKGLGGHKKAHKNDVFENKSQGSISMEQEVDDTDNVFGLKPHVDTEKEANLDLGLKPWMLKGDRKHKPLLITASAN